MKEKYDGKLKMKQMQERQDTLRREIKQELAALSEEQERSDVMVTSIELYL